MKKRIYPEVDLTTRITHITDTDEWQHGLSANELASRTSMNVNWIHRTALRFSPGTIVDNTNRKVEFTAHESAILHNEY